MAKLSEATMTDFLDVQNAFAESAIQCTSFDQIAQRMTDHIWRRFRESLALARVYVSIPYKKLPTFNRNFVKALAGRCGVEDKLTEETQTLTLAGTSGKRPEWNDRRMSKGHASIPLVTSAFVESVPMVARLMNDLGLGVAWIDKGDISLFEKVYASKIFFVPDAVSATDALGRKIIPAQDFVASEKVKTVFGVGGTFSKTGPLVVMILFSTDTLRRETAQQISTLVLKLVAASSPLVLKGALLGG